MAWHSVSEAQKLTGKSRRTLYRDMASGRLSWAPGEGDSRRLETSELIRAYGALLPVAQPGTEEVAQPGTANGTAEMAEILAELRALRVEVSELRQTLLRIEHKPENEAVAQDVAQPDNASEGSDMAHPGTGSGVPPLEQEPQKERSWWRSFLRLKT